MYEQHTAHAFCTLVPTIASAESTPSTRRDVMLLAAFVRQPPSSMAGSLADLTSRGVLRQHNPSSTLPGEVGSGYKSGANLAHIEPEEIWVLGTSHVSEQSALDVKCAIEALQPDAVVIELCRSRTGLLYAVDAPSGNRASNAFGLSGEGSALQVMQRSLALGGWVPLLLRAMLARLSSSVGSELNVLPGADFRAAKTAAEACNATLVLGDRPIEITLERCWRALGWGERADIVRALSAAFFSGSSALGQAKGDATAWSDSVSSADRRSEMQALLDSALGVGAADGDQCVDVRSPDYSVGTETGPAERATDTPADTLQAMEMALGERFPSVVEPLLKERNVFLSLTMKSSYAVSGKRRVLGVVGVGHLDGVVKALREEHTGAFKELTWTPSRAMAKQKVLGVLPRPLVTRLATDAMLGVLAWCWWTGGGFP